MKEDDDNLYIFMNTAQQFAEIGNPITREVQTYLEAKSTNIQSLADYAAVAKAFVKANSTLPSNAAVKRLFSTAGMILSPRRCKMTDKLFDKVVFLNVAQLAFRLHNALLSTVSMPCCSLQFNCDFRTTLSKQNTLRIFYICKFGNSKCYNFLGR
jgi:hypothetical protein